MKVLRTTFISRIVAMATAVVFLNMSFFLGEVAFLKLHDHNIEILENLVKVLAGSMEEEGDGLNESGEENFETAIDIHFSTLCDYKSKVISAGTKKIAVINFAAASQSIHEIATPPPRIS